MTEKEVEMFRIIILTIIVVAVCMITKPASAQNRVKSNSGSGSSQEVPRPTDDSEVDLQPVPRPMKNQIQTTNYIAPPPSTIEDLSFIYVAERPLHEFKEHDILEVIVDEKATTTSKSQFNRQRTFTLKNEIKEFFRLNDDGFLRPGAQDGPKIDVSSTARLQSNGQINDSEGMQYRIGVFIEKIHENGNIVIAGHKEIVYNKEVWIYQVHGTIRKEDIQADNTILSSKIVNGGVHKDTKGKVYDSTKRPWGIRLMDMMSPF